MAIYDVFNGDADGICALLQLRLHEPKTSQLITGVKRDIQLLKQVQATSGDEISVLDISLDKNRVALQTCLAAGASVRYFDHHNPGEIPDHSQLECHIDTDANTCTSLIVNNALGEPYPHWAITGAFGDNMETSATKLTKKLKLNEKEIDLLRKLGTYINYNGYGPDQALLHFRPAELFTQLLPFANPLDFIKENSLIFEKLENGYLSDMQAADILSPVREQSSSAIYILPNEDWAKRVSGVFGNQLASQYPGRAHAIITELDSTTYLVSVRAPLENKTGADEICMQFPSGGGRKGAAGINQLPADMLDKFIAVFEQYYESSV